MPDDEQRTLCQEMLALGRELPQEAPRAGFDRQRWQRCCSSGLLGLNVPTENGGRGHDLVTTTMALAAFAEGCADPGLVFALNAMAWSVVHPLARFGTRPQQERYLAPALRGDRVGAHAATEPDHGSDVMSMVTRARREGDEYVLDGAKTFVTSAPVADFVLTFATVDASLGAMALTAFLVDRGTPGLDLTPLRTIDRSGAVLGEVVLQGCRVPVDHRLGGEGAGSSIFASSMVAERTGIFAGHLGAMRRILGTATACPAFTDRGATADRLARARCELDAAWLLLLRVAATADGSRQPMGEAAAAKILSSEAHVRAAVANAHLHGSCGCPGAAAADAELLGALPGTIYSGTNEIQRDLVGRMLGL